jgi:hypothetical protein
LIARYYALVHEAHRGPRRRMSKARRKVFERTKGRCSVPGCSRPGCHVHHVVFRSRGGARETWNEILLCAAHHLHGVHLGHLTVEGRAGEKLVWRFGKEVWITEGDDHVRRPRPGECEGDGAPGAEGGDRVREGAGETGEDFVTCEVGWLGKEVTTAGRA